MLIKSSPAEFGISLADPFIRNYLILWVSLLLTAVLIVILKKRTLQLHLNGYFEFLFIKWKLVTFGLAGFFVTFAGYWTDDESWDLISGFGMSLLTYLFAPLSVGVLYRFAQLKESILNVFLALIFSFFSFSWFYDGYLLIRDNSYTQRWYGNLILSSAIYLCAGIFWNLEINKNNKIILGFARSDWPKPPLNKNLGKASLLALPFGALAFYILVGFVGWDFEQWASEDRLTSLQFIFSIIGGLGCPLILATIFWRNAELKKFPITQGLVLIIPSFIGLFALPSLLGLVKAGMAVFGDNPGSIGGITLAWIVVTPFYWMSLYLLYRYLKK